MPNGNRLTSIVPPEVPRRVYTETEVYPHRCLLDLLIVILEEKRTGSLTINFAGGKPDGTAEWKRHMKQPPTGA
jgi:hypothetical protein